MASFNKVILLGNLTRDPELRYAPSGTPIVRFGLAVNTQRSGQGSNEQGNNERREEVCFVDIVAFGRQAETASEFLSKGRAALIEGRLQWRSWEGQDGQKRSKHEVIADRIQFMPRGREEGPDGPAPTQSRQGLERTAPGPGMEHTSPGSEMERTSSRPSRVGEEFDAPPLEDDDIPF
jgi:single-strand DNA-binding protein